MRRDVLLSPLVVGFDVISEDRNEIGGRRAGRGTGHSVTVVVSSWWLDFKVEIRQKAKAWGYSLADGIQ
jgi:hypothetical protein